ncbi:hypothetical protein PYW07_000087 [Mythimna separata]|uniref:FP protein C-terminal domain-containing protein n=1 Tax=Mythimna separata TaxID=271217 RepID=A0AAD7Z2B0_MYTSE|nr:hypothetical protein PYW07_000087 [Mythimna separata]
MTPTSKSSWSCKNCSSKQTKVNTSSPLLNKTSLSADCISPSVFDDSTDDEECNITLRQKPKTRNVSMDNLVSELDLEDKLRAIIKQELNCFLETKIKILITDQLKQMSEQITDFKDSMNFYNSQYETLKACLEEKDASINKLQAENERLLAASAEHSARLSLVEQSLRVNNVEINGIPEYKAENVITTVIQLAKTVGESLEDGDILHATRVAKLNTDSSRPRPVVVKLRTPRLRDSLLAAVVNYNKKKQPQDKLNSINLGIGGDRTPVYVSEHLCPANKQLHAATRKLAKELDYKFVWVRNGRVFVRKDVSHAAILIRNLDSLALLNNNK